MRWLRLALTGVQFFAFTVVFAQGQSPLPVQPLKGHVETADDHKPLAGVKMTLGKLSIVTDQQGDFSFAEVSPGAFIVRAELNGYLLRVHRGIVVAGLTPDPFTMRLPRAASIEGVVEDPDGHPLADAAVGLLSQRFAGTVTSDAVPVRTDAQGRFLIQTSSLAPTSFAPPPRHPPSTTNARSNRINVSIIRFLLFATFTIQIRRTSRVLCRSCWHLAAACLIFVCGSFRRSPTESAEM